LFFPLPSDHRENGRRRAKDDHPDVGPSKIKRKGRKRSDHVKDAVSHLTLRCDSCGKEYATHVGLAYHKARAHNKATGDAPSTPYSCDKCSEGFETSGDLCRHRQHSDCGVEYEKFPCLRCEKQFSTKNALRWVETCKKVSLY
jgi:hypothetical protein